MNGNSVDIFGFFKNTIFLSSSMAIFLENPNNLMFDCPEMLKNIKNKPLFRAHPGQTLKIQLHQYLDTISDYLIPKIKRVVSWDNLITLLFVATRRTGSETIHFAPMITIGHQVGTTMNNLGEILENFFFSGVKILHPLYEPARPTLGQKSHFVG